MRDSQKYSMIHFCHSLPHRLRHSSPVIFAMQLLQWVLLCLAHRYGKKGRARFMHSRYSKDFFKTLSIEEQRCRYRKIPWCALIPLKLSPWQKVLHSRNEQAYITMMGFDAMTFDRILEKFCPMYSGYTPFDPSVSWAICWHRIQMTKKSRNEEDTEIWGNNEIMRLKWMKSDLECRSERMCIHVDSTWS